MVTRALSHKKASLGTYFCGGKKSRWEGSTSLRLLIEPIMVTRVHCDTVLLSAFKIPMKLHELFGYERAFSRAKPCRCISLKPFTSKRPAHEVGWISTRSKFYEDIIPRFVITET